MQSREAEAQIPHGEGTVDGTACQLRGVLRRLACVALSRLLSLKPDAFSVLGADKSTGFGAYNRVLYGTMAQTS